MIIDFFLIYIYNIYLKKKQNEEHIEQNNGIIFLKKY